MSGLHVSRSFVRTGLLMLVAVCATARTALACPSCFGASDGPAAQASAFGIGVLLVVTVCVLGGVALLMATLARRARAAALAVVVSSAVPAGERV